MTHPPIRRGLMLTGACALAFVVMAVAVSSGWLRSTDRTVASTAAAAWVPSMQVIWQGIALLGGLEMTTLIGLGLLWWLWREGYRTAILALLALPVATLAELLYKRIVDQPAPSGPHQDGPSLTGYVVHGLGSFPSGHVARAIVAYGLLAFVASRLGRGRARALAIPVAVAVMLLVAVDRVYLEVHWETDVIGGVMLGATMLAAAVTWMEWTALSAKD